MRQTLGGLAAVGALAVAGCTSSASSQPSSTASAAAASSPAAPVRNPVPAGELAGHLDTGLKKITSVHLTVNAKASGQNLAGSGDARLDAGTITAADITQALPGGLGDIRLVIDGGKTYAKLPAALVSGSKPWLLITAGSKDPVVSQVSGVLDTIRAVASPSSLVAFARAAISVDQSGTAQIGGATAKRYAVLVDPAKLPPTFPTTLTGGKKPIPVQMYLDDQQRPVRVTATFPLLGDTITPTITLSAFDRPVTVSAPPAGQVAAK